MSILTIKSESNVGLDPLLRDNQGPSNVSFVKSILGNSTLSFRNGKFASNDRVDFYVNGLLHGRFPKLGPQDFVITAVDSTPSGKKIDEAGPIHRFRNSPTRGKGLMGYIAKHGRSYSYGYLIYDSNKFVPAMWPEDETDNPQKALAAATAVSARVANVLNAYLNSAGGKAPEAIESGESMISHLAGSDKAFKALFGQHKTVGYSYLTKAKFEDVKAYVTNTKNKLTLKGRLVTRDSFVMSPIKQLMGPGQFDFVVPKEVLKDLDGVALAAYLSIDSVMFGLIGIKGKLLTPIAAFDGKNSNGVTKDFFLSKAKESIEYIQKKHGVSTPEQAPTQNATLVQPLMQKLQGSANVAAIESVLGAEHLTFRNGKFSGQNTLIFSADGSIFSQVTRLKQGEFVVQALSSAKGSRINKPGDWLQYKNVPANAQGLLGFIYRGAKKNEQGYLALVDGKFVPALFREGDADRVAIIGANHVADRLNAYVMQRDSGIEFQQRDVPGKQGARGPSEIPKKPAPVQTKPKTVSLEDLPSKEEIEKANTGPQSDLIVNDGDKLEAALDLVNKTPQKVRERIFSDFLKHVINTPDPLERFADVVTHPAFESFWENMDADQIQDAVQGDMLYKSEDKGQMKQALAALADMDAVSGYETGYTFYLVLYGAYDDLTGYKKDIPARLRKKPILDMAHNLGMITEEDVKGLK